MEAATSDHAHGTQGAACCGDRAPHHATAIDPVCGMSVDSATAKHQIDHHGETYYFCSAGCRTKFAAEPARYLDRTRGMQQRETAPDGAIYTCPMHPEISQSGPGACPICGMALEPEAITLDAAPNHELADMTRRFWIGAALALPVVVLEMGSHFVGAHRLVEPILSNWIQLIFATPVVLWAGCPFFVRGWQSLVSRNLNMFTLIALGTGVAYAESVVATALPESFPPAFRAHGAAPVYFEAASVIMVLVLLGQVLELRTRDATSGAIKALLRLAPRTARLIDPAGHDREVAVEALTEGDHIRVRAGDQVPVDGTILEGSAALDESLVTGEALAVMRETGGKVIAGTLVQSGSLAMRADQIGGDTMLARIVRMVAQAQRSRAPIQRIADRVAGWFVPFVLVVAALTFVTWAAIGPQPPLGFALVAAVSVLIIACPCALGLATPMSIMVGIGRGAQAGVLVRDAAALDQMERVDTLVIDKTGTLTEGKPRVTAIVVADGFAENDVLQLVASVERASAHPLADAILRAAFERNITPSDVTDFDAPPGRGARGIVDGHAVVVGNVDFLDAAGIATASARHDAEALRRDGATVVHVAIDGRHAALIAIADPIKASAAAALAALRAEGIRVIMLTGDNRTTAAAVAGSLGIDEIEADVLPEQKGAWVQALRARGRVVAMAGDGVNDAPALAAADVGIAMGTGADVAIEAAGITLVRGDLAGIVRARRLSQATMRNIRQNLLFAFIYNGAGIPLAAGLLYPAFGHLLSPVIAAAAMSFSSVSVIGNALRLRRLSL